MTSFRGFLAERGLVPPEALERAVRRQQAHGEDLALNLLELGAVEEAALAGYLGGFHQLPSCSLEEIESAPAAATEALPVAQALRHRICAVGLNGERLVVAAAWTLEPAALADLQQASGRPIELRIATPVAVARGLRVQFGVEMPDRHRRALARLRPEERTAVSPPPERTEDGEPDPEPVEEVPGPPEHGRSIDRTGEIIDGRYRLTRRVGEGGLGAVYEAHHLAIERRYAVKVLHAEVARDGELVTRFQHDPQAAAATGHPGIAEVYDVGLTADGVPFLVEEFVGGAGLAAYLREGSRLAVGWTVEVVLRLLSALSAAHGRGILHRNLKPSNVLVVQEPGAPPDVRLVDFGGSALVRFTDSGLVRTGLAARRAFRDGRLVGTPKYLAPEQIAGDVALDARADLYAVGALLYECVTGRAPFEDPDPQRLAMRVLSDRLPRPIERNPSIPLGLDLAILRALARERDERYHTAEELIRDLAPFVPARVRARLGLHEDEPTHVYDGVGRDRRSLPPRGPDTEVDRRPRGFSWSAFAAFVSLAAVAATIAWLRPWERDDGALAPPAAPASAPAAAQAPASPEVSAAPAERDWVVISVTGLPPEAVTLYDGAPVPALPLVAKRSYGAVTFEVQAPGFERYKRLVVPDRDQQLDVTLPAAPAASAAPPAAASGEPPAAPAAPLGEAATTTPVGPVEPQPQPAGQQEPPPPAPPAAPRPAVPSRPTARPAAPRDTAATAPPRPRPSAEAPAPAPSGARLSVISRPWSRITIDGRSTGRRTPLVEYELSAGLHRVCLETDDGRQHCAAVQVEAGRTSRLTHQF